MTFRGYGRNWLGFWITPAVRLLLWITAGVFVLQWLLPAGSAGMFDQIFGLNRSGMLSGMLWQPVSYIFLHASFWHIFFNMLGLFFFGPEVERVTGRRRFILLYLACGVIGGLGWLLISGAGRVSCVGASGAVFGVLGMFAALFPERPITLLLFFVIPVTIRARSLAILLGIISLFMMISQPGQVAYAAHLAGGVSGYAYGMFIARGRAAFFRFKPSTWWNNLLWHWHRRRFNVISGSGSSGSTWRSASNPEAESEEVDAILDKVSRYGLGSLTRREREILERAGRR